MDIDQVIVKENICSSPSGLVLFSLKEYLKEQLFSMSGAQEKPLHIRPLKMTVRSVEDQPSAFNPFQVYKEFRENMLDQVCRN